MINIADLGVLRSIVSEMGGAAEFFAQFPRNPPTNLRTDLPVLHALLSRMLRHFKSQPHLRVITNTSPVLHPRPRQVQSFRTSPGRSRNDLPARPMGTRTTPAHNPAVSKHTNTDPIFDLFNAPSQCNPPPYSSPDFTIAIGFHLILSHWLFFFCQPC